MPRGGKRPGAGRPALPLAQQKVQVSITLSLTAIEAVNERALPGERFSTTLDRMLNALPIITAPPQHQE